MDGSAHPESQLNGLGSLLVGEPAHRDGNDAAFIVPPSVNYYLSPEYAPLL